MTITRLEKFMKIKKYFLQGLDFLKKKTYLLGKLKKSRV